MKQNLIITGLFFQTVIITLLFATIFVTKPAFFQHLIAAKQWGVELVILIAIIFLVLHIPFVKKIKITTVDLGILSLSLWWIVSEIIFHNDFQPLQQVEFYVLLWLTVYLLIRCSSANRNFVWGIAIIYLTTSLFQSILGLMQLYGFTASFHGLFKITGTFHNPGPFSGFVISALPLALIGYTEKGREKTEGHRDIFIKRVRIRIFPKKIFSVFFRGLSLLTFIAILLIVPAAKSRAAWLAGLAGCLYILWNCKDKFPIINRLLDHIKKLSAGFRALLIVGISIFIVCVGTGLYIMKKGSANGRLLIWQITSQLIKERPLAGYGSGAFNALYIKEQAKWFESKKGTEAQALIAGSPESPFNELLHLWLEKGLIGLILAASILGSILFHRKHQNIKSSTQNTKLKTPNSAFPTQDSKPKTLLTGFRGTLLSILTFSLFSYPFDISSFILQIVVVVAVLASSSRPLFSIKGHKCLLLSLPLAIILIAGAIWYFPKRLAYYAALKTWNKADQFYNMRSFNVAVETYHGAFPVLKYNGLFLQMYSKALSMEGQFKKSNHILTMAQKHLSSYIIFNTFGDNYKALKDFDKAEAAYIQSRYMVPSLLLPKYLLAKLYEDSGKHKKAIQTAGEILNSPVKIESTATHEIMNEMRNIMTQDSTTFPDIRGEKILKSRGEIN
jgi:O-antigen polymerase